jgi:hypothetical protein
MKRLMLSDRGVLSPAGELLMVSAELLELLPACCVNGRGALSGFQAMFGLACSGWCAWLGSNIHGLRWPAISAARLVVI